MVVREVGYLHRPRDVALEVRAAEVVAAYNRTGVPVVLVTNQSGVARGYFGWPDFEAVQARIAGLLAAGGAHLDAVFACGCHADGLGSMAVDDHPWRKPAPGMFLAAAEQMDIDLACSVVVGDRADDLAAGRAAGLPIGLHVATGHGGRKEQVEAAALERPGFQVTLAPDIGGALDLLPRFAEA